jgi:hypothetical protein
MVWWARPGEVIIRGRLPAVAIVSAAGVVGLARTVDRLVPDHARVAVTMTVRRPTVARECVRIEMQGLKGVLASETRPAGTGVSRPEAAVGSD